MENNRKADSRLTRRLVLQGAAALTASALSPRSGQALAIGATKRASPANQPTLIASDHYAVVETSAGKVRGYSRNQIFTFRGIPYGASTEGSARFMPPAKVQGWSGTRNAYQFGHASPQGAIGFLSGDELKFIVRDFPGPQGEDCLCLNVWTPAINDNSKRPVMVWFHGGGFTIGSGNSEPVYDGENLARHDVVVVTVNHRLGPFGFLDLSALGERYASSANVGMLDLVAALEWVRDNAANFGGDAANVTIFGQSGGGGKVGTLMAMPAAKGLIHKAIIQSGSFLSIGSPDRSQRLASAVMEELGLNTSQADELQKIPFEKLVQAGDEATRKLNQPRPGSAPPRIGSEIGWGPVAEGSVLPAHSWESIAPSVSADVPLMVGTDLNEFNVASDHPEYALWTEEDLRGKVASTHGDRASAVIATFRKNYPEAKPFDLYSIIATAVIRQTAVTQAERKAKLGAAPAYLYWFTWGSPLFEGRPGSCHGLEIPFAFDNTELGDYMTGGGSGPKALAEKMSGAWVNFARTGDPNHRGLPTWPNFSAEQCETMIFNDTCQARSNPDTEERKILFST